MQRRGLLAAGAGPPARTTLYKRHHAHRSVAAAPSQPAGHAGDGRLYLLDIGRPSSRSILGRQLSSTTSSSSRHRSSARFIARTITAANSDSEPDEALGEARRVRRSDADAPESDGHAVQRRHLLRRRTTACSRCGTWAATRRTRAMRHQQTASTGTSPRSMSSRGTNIVNVGHRDSSTTWIDWNEANPARRYKDGALARLLPRDLHLARRHPLDQDGQLRIRRRSLDVFLQPIPQRVGSSACAHPADSPVRGRKYWETPDFSSTAPGGPRTVR